MEQLKVESSCQSQLRRPEACGGTGGSNAAAAVSGPWKAPSPCSRAISCWVREHRDLLSKQLGHACGSQGPVRPPWRAEPRGRVGRDAGQRGLGPARRPLRSGEVAETPRWPCRQDKRGPSVAGPRAAVLLWGWPGAQHRTPPLALRPRGLAVPPGTGRTRPRRMALSQESFPLASPQGALQARTPGPAPGVPVLRAGSPATERTFLTRRQVLWVELCSPRIHVMKS